MKTNFQIQYKYTITPKLTTNFTILQNHCFFIFTLSFPIQNEPHSNFQRVSYFLKLFKTELDIAL